MSNKNVFSFPGAGSHQHRIVLCQRFPGFPNVPTCLKTRNLNVFHACQALSFSLNVTHRLFIVVFSQITMVLFVISINCMKKNAFYDILWAKNVSLHNTVFENSKFLSEIVYVTDDVFNIRLARNSFKPA